jgi:hypothetical protein
MGLYLPRTLLNDPGREIPSFPSPDEMRQVRRQECGRAAELERAAVADESNRQAMDMNSADQSAGAPIVG